jgi:hypothetical protein
MFNVTGILHHMRLNALQKMADVAMQHLWLGLDCGNVWAFDQF